MLTQQNSENCIMIAIHELIIYFSTLNEILLTQLPHNQNSVLSTQTHRRTIEADQVRNLLSI